MIVYDEANSGVLFLNDKKSEKAPEWSGTYNHEGEEIKLVGWVRTSSKTGKQFISIKRDTYEPKVTGATGYERAKAKAEEIKDRVAEVTDDPISLDDIPF